MERTNKCELFYFDESGFSQKSNLPYCWGPIGVQSLRPAHSHSKRLNVLGFLSRQGKLSFQTTEGRVTTDTVIDAFEHFINARKNDKPCFIILDNASFHRSAKFKQKLHEWLMNDVLVCYLPPYSPELNIIEILWKKVKYEWLPCEAFKTFEDLSINIKNILNYYGEKFTITFA